MDADGAVIRQERSDAASPAHAYLPVVGGGRLVGAGASGESFNGGPALIPMHR